MDERLNEKMKSLVINEKPKLRKRDRRRFLKIAAEKIVLKRKVPKRASKLLKEFPNLGKDIEDFEELSWCGSMEENRCGHHCWQCEEWTPYDILQNKISEKVQLRGNCSCHLFEIRGANLPNATGVQLRSLAEGPEKD